VVDTQYGFDATSPKVVKMKLYYHTLMPSEEVHAGL